MAERKKKTDDETTQAEDTAPDEEVRTDAAEAAPADAPEEPVVGITAEAEEPVAEVPAEAEEAPVEEPPAVEPGPAVEAVAEAEAPTAAEAPAEEAPAEVAPAEVAAEPAGEAAPASVAKPKRKRLPRALRPARSRPKRAKPTQRKPIVRLEKPERARGRSQERQGTVVSDGMDKTIVVKVDVTKAHPKYKKVVRRSTKFHAHDERNEAKVGDVVRIVEIRPLSRLKRWRLAEIVEEAK